MVDFLRSLVSYYFDLECKKVVIGRAGIPAAPVASEYVMPPEA